MAGTVGLGRTAGLGGEGRGTAGLGAALGGGEGSATGEGMGEGDGTGLGVAGDGEGEGDALGEGLGVGVAAPPVRPQATNLQHTVGGGRVAVAPQQPSGLDDRGWEVPADCSSRSSQPGGQAGQWACLTLRQSPPACQDRRRPGPRRPSGTCCRTAPSKRGGKIHVNVRPGAKRPVGSGIGARTNDWALVTSGHK